MRILFIEDEKLTAETIAEKLRFNHSVDIAMNGRKAVKLADENEYDLFIIDYNLPDRSGITICKRLREDDVETPILMLTGRTAIRDKVKAFEAGADDYMTKPFNFEELQARIRALLRRRYPESDHHPVLKIADLEYDTRTQEIIRAGKSVVLRRKERQLFEYMLRNRGRIITRDMMMQHMWDGAADPIGNVIDVHIKHLRDKVDKGFSPQLIKTIYGLGYKIDAGK